MRVGVIVPMSAGDGQGRVPSWPEIHRFAAHAEDSGLDSLWVCDHFISAPPGGPPEGIHEGWTVLAALAASTSRVELGQLVTCTSFRNPGLLAKMAVTVDGISGGRLTLGLGAGWYDAEYEAFGYPTEQRFSRFEEAFEIVRRLLVGERVTFSGRHHVARGAELLPAPGRRIPILVAAGRPRSLRLTARWADAWNTAWYGAPNERLVEELGRLDRALAAEGRDPESFRRTVGIEVRDPDAASADPGAESFAPSVDELARTLEAHAALGIDDVIVVLEPMTERSLDRLAEAVSYRGN